MTFQELLQEVSKRAAKNKFAPKVKCGICFGLGVVSIAPTFNNAGTGEIVRQPCQRCGGTGEHSEW